MRRNVLVATFTDADALMSAVPAMRRESLRVHDVYAPYPIHGLDRAMGLRRMGVSSWRPGRRRATREPSSVTIMDDHTAAPDAVPSVRVRSTNAEMT